MPVKKKAAPKKAVVKKAAKAAAPARSERHPNDVALSTLLARQETLHADMEAALELMRSQHPNDPALSSLLARLSNIEVKLEQLLAVIEKGSPRLAPPKPVPAMAAPAGAVTAAPDTDTSQFLARTPLFAKLSAAECAVLAQYLETKTLPAGTVLFQQGDFGDAMYVVKAGSLEIYKNDVFGAVRVAEVRPGGLVGEMALVENKPRSANVRASDESRLLLLSRGSYAQLKQAHPLVATKFQDELLLLLSGRLRQTTEKLVGK